MEIFYNCPPCHQTNYWKHHHNTTFPPTPNWHLQLDIQSIANNPNKVPPPQTNNIKLTQTWIDNIADTSKKLRQMPTNHHLKNYIKLPKKTTNKYRTTFNTKFKKIHTKSTSCENFVKGKSTNQVHKLNPQTKFPLRKSTNRWHYSNSSTFFWGAHFTTTFATQNNHDTIQGDTLSLYLFNIFI